MATTATEFDAIARWAGKNDKRMINQLLNGLDFLNDVRVIRNVDSHGMLLPKMIAEKGIRQLNLNVEEPNGKNRTFGGRKIFVYPAMKIIKVVAEEARKTFMSEMLDPKAKQIPFAQWIWEREFEKIGSEINDSIYLGERGEPEAFDSGAAYAVGDLVTFGDYEDVYKANAITVAGESPTTDPAKWDLVNDAVISTGWGTIIADEITAGTIAGANLVTTGAIDNTNALDSIETMLKDMTVAHRKKGGIFRLAPDTFRAYLEHERDVYPSAANPSFGDGEKFVYGSGKKWVIREASWMGASGRVIATQKDNLAFGTFLESDANKIAKTVETLHGYKSIVKWLQGCEIADLETLYVNDQA